MTEKQIQLLGCEKHSEEGTVVKDLETGKQWTEDAFYYYTYTIAQGFEFISNSNDEVGEDGQWYLEFFDSDPEIRFTEFGEVQALINLLEKRRVKNEKTV